MLLHARAGIEFPTSMTTDIKSTELDSLGRLLGLPTVDGLIQDCVASGPVGSRLQHLLSFWINHWRIHRYSPTKPPPGPRSRSTGLMDQQDAILRDIFSSSFTGEFAQTDLHVPAPPGAFVEDPTPEPEPVSARSSGTITGPHTLRLPHPGIYELVSSISRIPVTTLGSSSSSHGAADIAHCYSLNPSTMSDANVTTCRSPFPRPTIRSTRNPSLAAAQPRKAPSQTRTSASSAATSSAARPSAAASRLRPAKPTVDATSINRSAAAPSASSSTFAKAPLRS